MDITTELERIRNARLESAGDPIKAKALYDKIIEELYNHITNNHSFDDKGCLTVYSVQAESNSIPVTDQEQLMYSKNIARINYIRNNQVYLEWYFTKQLNQPGYNYHIKIEQSIENSLMGRKTKTTLNIVLQRPY